MKIFIASSGELNDERDESTKVITELNKLFPHLHIEPVLFELNTVSGNNPGMKRIQDGINPLLDESEIVVVLFHSKIGEFTKEEFDRAIQGEKKIFLYLKDGFQPKNSGESNKYTEVLALKEEIERKSEIRYQKFVTITDYNGLLYKDLNKYIKDKYVPSAQGEISNIKLISITPENKLSDFPKPSILFTGREKEIKVFKNLFESSRIFAIEGLGGTGKTQFVSKCIEEIIEDKSKIIWLNGSVQSNFNVFVETAGYGDVLKGEKKTDLALYSGLKDLIEKDERVIFWDNYNDYEDSTFSQFLSFAYQYLRKATIILITKTEPSIDRITSLPVIKLEGLSEDAIEYAKKLKASNSKYTSISDLDLEIICQGTEGHPLAIEFSMLLMGYGKSAEDIMIHMPEFSTLKKVEEFSKRLFFDIFYHPKTSDEERECFLKCSVFKERLKEEEIKFLYDGKDVFHLLAGLMDKLLITSKEGFFEMHPLVRAFSYEKLTDKKEVHKKAADYFISQRLETLNASLEEKIFYHLSEAQEWESIASSIESVGRKFIQQGQLGLINEFMNKVENSNVFRSVFEIFKGDIAQIKGEWNKAIIHFEKASFNTIDNTVKAEGMIKHGEILFRRGDIKDSLPYFEEAYNFAKVNILLKEEARAINDIGLVCFTNNTLEVAYEKYMIALKIRKEILDIEGMADSYNNIAIIFSTREQFVKSLEYHDESMKIAQSMGNKIAIANSYNNISHVLISQKKLDEALIKVNLALNINKEIGNKVGIGNCLNNIGAILIEQGNFSEGLLKYKKGLEAREEIGDRTGIANSYANIGTVYCEDKNYDIALNYFFRSLEIIRQIGLIMEERRVLNWIGSFNRRIGKEKFKELANEVYQNLNIETQKHINIKEFFNEPQVRETPKIGRNDPCTCGSGKKYKKCHGQ